MLHARRRIVVLLLFCSACNPSLTPNSLPGRIVNANRFEELRREREIADLVRKLVSPDLSERRGAAEKLIATGDGALAELVRAAKSGEQDLQIESIKLLGEMRMATAVDPLISVAGESPYPEVRREAAQAIGVIADPSAVTGLLYLAEREKSAYVRRTMAWTFGEMRDRRATPALTAWIERGPDVVREEAIPALGKIGDERGVTPLLNRWRAISKYEDEREQVRLAEALGEIRSGEALSFLGEAASSSPFASVRRACSEALEKIHRQEKP